MNLLAFSQQDPTVFYAAELDSINCFRIGEEGCPPFHTLQCVSGRSTTESNRAPDRRIPINCIHIGYLGSAEVLVAADEAAQVHVWYTNDLDHSPICITVE